jgi:ABC-type Na+ efflux pump permease subunit
MRFSKAWLIAARDFKIFRRQRNIWYSIVVFPVIISVLFPLVLEYAGNKTGGIPAAAIPTLLNSFSFFFVIGAAFVPLGIASYSIVGEKVEKSLEPLLALLSLMGRFCSEKPFPQSCQLWSQCMLVLWFIWGSLMQWLSKNLAIIIFQIGLSVLYS